MSTEHERGDGAADLDREAFRPGFGTGGVPWYLMILYLSFLVFFTWYVLEFQLADYLELRAENRANEAPLDPGEGTPAASESGR